ncbi:MAG: phage BR0599 family protein, partial [Gemmatimonadaceae bacterium]|nr:phage BR0599 family protein [Gemmatimonadaceae bacterium]
FDLGIVRFTSGALSGVSRVVRSHVQSGGVLRLVAPLPAAPAPGDGIAVTPGCDKRQATCSSKFSNLARFRGYPYIPVPETLYDGGAAAGMAPAPGGQGSIIGGSEYTGLIDPLTYVP